MIRTPTKLADSSRAQSVAPNRKETENVGDPRGQFGSFLRHWLDSQPDRTAAKERIANAAGVSTRAVGKWEEGVAGPPLQYLDDIAKAMGLKDWAKLAAAAVKHGDRK